MVGCCGLNSKGLGPIRYGNFFFGGGGGGVGQSLISSQEVFSFCNLNANEGFFIYSCIFWAIL